MAPTQTPLPSGFRASHAQHVLPAVCGADFLGVRLLLLLAILVWTACSPAPAPSRAALAAESGPVGTVGATSPAAAAQDLVFPTANRPDVRGAHGAVSSDHPLASAVGYQVLQDGGNAVDAAVAMAAVLAVVRPHMNGVGGDVFALFHDGSTGRVVALNGSGRAGRLATPEFFGDADEVPGTGPLSVSVPGAVAGWQDALERFGTKSLAELLQPAIAYARDGFPVSWRLRSDIESQGGSLDRNGRALFLPGGQPPALGSRLRNQALAKTLETIAAQGKDGFYQGPIAEKLADYVRNQGGYLTPADFASHVSEWVEPLTVEYLGHNFHALPPNTQGITQLQQFEMAKSFSLKDMGHNTSSYIHVMTELRKLAGADRDRWVGDPARANIPIDDLLDPDYLKGRASGVSLTQAAERVESGIGSPLGVNESEGEPPDDSGDTVYLTAVDSEGNAVSWIQSLFAGFGSGLVEPETGVVLHNRGSLFVLLEGHPNRIAPGKRPFHTLTPLLAHRDGRLAFTVGTPGGDSQTESLFQIVNNLLLFGMTPQEAVEAARYRVGSGLQLSIEDRIDPRVRAELESRGHRLLVIHGWTATFGGAQMIFVHPESGTLAAAADPRREAYALAY